jgi:hypothetical protein
VYFPSERGKPFAACCVLDELDSEFETLVDEELHPQKIAPARSIKKKRCMKLTHVELVP